MTAQLRNLVPDGVAVSEGHTLVDTDVLLPAEAEHVRRSVPKRRVEFATGRDRARRALAELGVSGAAGRPIGVGDRRQPVWPAGVVGSITHCTGYTAAAAAWTEEFLAVGIDAEVNESLPPDVVEQVSLRTELAELPPDAAVAWPTVLHSAREAVFKAWFPATRLWLGHHDVRIAVDARRRAFQVDFVDVSALRGPGAHVEGLEGAIGWSERHVFAAVWVRA